MQTNYMGHDAAYRQKRSAGQAGWDSAEQSKQTLANIAAFLSGVRFPDRPTLLELGCGAGNVTLHFARQGWAAFGVDISPFAVEWARQKAAEEGLSATFAVADLSQPLNLPLPLADLVLDGHCLHCIIGSDRRVFLQNVKRSLRPDGLLCVDTMCGEPAPAFAKNFDPASRCTIHQGIAARFLGLPDGILQELRDAGFEIVKHKLLPADPDDPADQDSLLVLARAAR